MTKRRRLSLIAAAVVVAAVPATLVLAEGSDWPGPDRFGVIVPGKDAIVGPRPVLHGRVPPASQGPVQIRVYRGSARSAPVITASVPVTGSFWSLPVKLGAGSYSMRVQRPVPGGRPLTWLRSFSVSDAPIIAAAGDIACDPANASFHNGAGSPSGRNCQERATSDALVGADLTTVLTLGDEQYEAGQLSAFEHSFGPTWGRLKQLIHPAPGNHEELPPHPTAGYFAYFNSLAHRQGAVGTAGNGWYSFDIGEWHMIALNSNCNDVGGCGTGSPELRWLEADLRAHPARCTLAFWHHPRYSSGKHGDDTAMTPIWQALEAAGTDLVLVGHDHDYERFAPQTADGRRDYRLGIREFVVGTGGKSHDPLRSLQPNSQARDSTTYGVLELVLHPDRYDWRFVPVLGKHFTDGGSAACH
jgi:Calcineurin-like phosphoesterase